MRRLLVLAAFALAACPPLTVPQLPELASFKVDVSGVFVRTGGNRAPLGVVASCLERFGGDPAAVPEAEKGTPGCRYLIPTGEVEFDLVAQGLTRAGEPYTDFNGSVSFRVIPGDLAADQKSRWALAELGKVTASVRALHPYGEVRVWVEDAPPKALYDGGEPLVAVLPPEPQYPARRTYASGTSRIIYFADQTLQSLQLPGEFDNRSSPFVGEFVVVGKNPESGDTLKQSCATDPSRNNREALMVVTGLDPSGFFVTDISACRLVEQTRDASGSVQVRTPEPPEPCLVTLTDGGTEPLELADGGVGRCAVSERRCVRRADCPGYMPGTFGSMFIYNYNFPDGLDEGDLLFTLSGSVQEFTSTTQMVFPSWSVAERVRRLPPEQWNKWLQFARPYDISYRTCGMDNAAAPFLTDALCGHNRRNLKMESLESSLVRVRRVRFPRVFKNCDANANGSVPFFCESNPGGSGWQWSTCSFDAPEPEADRVERECNQACIIGLGEFAGQLCTEASTFRGFGQYVVEMASPGPARLGLDDSLPLRVKTAELSLAVAPSDGGVPGPNPTALVTGYAEGTEVVITCTAPARYAAGAGTASPGDDAPLVPADGLVRFTFAPGQTTLGLQATTEAGSCTVGHNARARINLITKDAVPDLDPDCNEADADAERAAQCRNLRGAEFDVIGHLRHVQPARPRWVVVPRAPDDLCCYPGPGLECPRPIQPCR